MEKKKLLSPLVISGLFICGFAAGYLYGSYSLNKFFNQRLSIVQFIFRPSGNLIKTYLLLNSNDELKRLEGYYSYRETFLKDEDFLVERYTLERSLIIKKTIIWIAEEKFAGEKLPSLYQKFYEVSSEDLKIYLQQKINNYTLDKVVKK